MSVSVPMTSACVNDSEMSQNEKADLVPLGQKHLNASPAQMFISDGKKLQETTRRQQNAF